MNVVINVHYKGSGGSARRFVEDMVSEGVLEAVRAEDGCIGYEYFVSFDDPESIVLIEHWRDEAALEAHACSENMKRISLLKDRHGLSSAIEKFSHRFRVAIRYGMQALQQRKVSTAGPSPAVLFSQSLDSMSLLTASTTSAEE